MDGHIGFKCLFLRGCLRVQQKTVGLALNRHDLRVQCNLNSKFSGCLDQGSHVIRVKFREWPAAAVHHPDLGAGPCRDVRELEGDVATANEGDPARQVVELQELRAGC